MGATLTTNLTHPFLEANLSVLTLRDPALVRMLRVTAFPSGLEEGAGRDGEPTFSWKDRRGNACWLGRTKMPGVRSAALIEAFAPGTGNVLFFGMGQGSEAKLLLGKMARGQALFVLEPDALAIKLCLALHDFQEDLSGGRLILLGGAEPWAGLEKFLCEHPGYLAPARILSWPWFGHTQIHEITNRLTQICQSISRHRSEAQQALVTAAASRLAGRATRIAILDYSGGRSARECAVGLGGAARQGGVSSRTFDNETPRFIHPLGVETELATNPASHVFLIDMAESAANISFPSLQRAFVITHGCPLAAAWIEQLGGRDVLAVRTSQQLTQIRGSGRRLRAVLQLAPAASIDGSSKTARGSGIAIAADRIDTSTASAGLHLGSHCRIYETVAKLAAERIDREPRAEAPQLLASALKALGINLQSEEVRRGLEQRVEQVLLPGIVSSQFVRAVEMAAVDCDLVGEGWEERGDQFSPQEVVSESEIGLLIGLDVRRMSVGLILDSLAAGISVALRTRDRQELDILEGVVDIDAHLIVFSSRKEMLEIIRRFQVNPVEFRRQAARAREHMLAAHTWSHRLADLIQACNGE